MKVFNPIKCSPTSNDGLIPKQLDYNLTIGSKRQLIVANAMEIEPNYTLEIEGELHIIE